MPIQHLTLACLLVIGNNIENEVGVDEVGLDYLTLLKHRSPLRYHLLWYWFVAIAIKDQFKLRNRNV